MSVFYKSGLTLIEMLVAIGILGVVSLSVADFSSNTFQVAFDHSQMVQKSSQTRMSADMIANEISKAAYIFPENQAFSLYASMEGYFTVNTDDSVVFLVDSVNGSSTPTYYLKAFFFSTNDNGGSDLYEFTSSSPVAWTANTLPYSLFSFKTGNVSVVATDINISNSSLEYILNRENGLSDSILKGSISGVDSSNSYALIKGVDFNIGFDDSTPVTIGGVSRNVPRFIS